MNTHRSCLAWWHVQTPVYLGIFSVSVWLCERSRPPACCHGNKSACIITAGTGRKYLIGQSQALHYTHFPHQTDDWKYWIIHSISLLSDSSEHLVHQWATRCVEWYLFPGAHKSTRAYSCVSLQLFFMPFINCLLNLLWSMYGVCCSPLSKEE